MSEPTPVITFENVDQVFVDDKGASLVALKNLTLSVGKHEFVAILGPSGCGKSTLLRQLAGLIAPTRGGLQIYGKTVTQPRDDIGIVFQRPTLLPWFDVLGNVTFVARHKYGRVTADDINRGRELLKGPCHARCSPCA